MNRNAIILISKAGLDKAGAISKEIGAEIITKHDLENTTRINSVSGWINENFRNYGSLIFIGATGIVLRYIAPHITDKYKDPAVICIDSTGRYVIPLLSGHIGGANELATEISHIIGALPVITTRSDNENLWGLDIIGKKYNWKTELKDISLNNAIFAFINKEKAALLLDIKDDGTSFMERTKPSHIDIFYKHENIRQGDYKFIIAVTPFIYDFNVPVLYLRPQILHLGLGCRRKCNKEGAAQYINDFLTEKNISAQSVSDLSTIDLKKDEELLKEAARYFGNLPVEIYSADQLSGITVPNPSSKVAEVTGSPGVSESAAIASAIKSSGAGKLLIEKQKVKLSGGNDFTFALAVNSDALSQAHIEIVGAGPGDPDLISVKGRRFLEAADLILYAGSLVPIELTYCAKPGATVVSSASMNLEEQFKIMREFYDKGKLIVRLHTGDPCIYGAIQEQMAYFDRYNMSYHITPGISSFQAAAAALNSQFTIPEKVQTIILTRGEGRTPVPDKEKLHLLAKSRSTMCIFLSASVADNVQNELLTHYPPDTPVAVCYKLTWKDQKIFRGKLEDLAQIVRENDLTLTTMIVVGEAIDNRNGLSKLYDDNFKHLFRN